MRFQIIGAGPAGLYTAVLLRRFCPSAEVKVFEQNSQNATFGFGVVFSRQALDFLRTDDPVTADLIEPEMTHWSDMKVNLRGESAVIDGVGFSAIGRLRLLELLQQRADEAGVEVSYNTRVENPGSSGVADLLIGADGLNSSVRQSDPEFGENLWYRKNRFIWYGADREFDALTQTFIDTPYGAMTAHHYAYECDRSTFIIEMTPSTFENARFSSMDEKACRDACESFFSCVLDGARLIPNRSYWRQFPELSCRRWYSGRKVLLGDALHTAHFSIGSGTRLALEDSIALVTALRESDWQIDKALPAFEAKRRPIVEKLTAAARKSADWYESFDEHMAANVWEFAAAYLQRSGRLSYARLCNTSPGFAASLNQRNIVFDATA